MLTSAQRGEMAGLHARMAGEMERELYTRAIQMAEGNQAKAARWLGVTRTTMREKLTHFDLRPAGEKPEETGISIVFLKSFCSSPVASGCSQAASH